MLNTWWKGLTKKPFGVKPVRIRHLVETAHAAGWSINECYAALNITWAFTESAFETALRRIADTKSLDAQAERVSTIASIEKTRASLDQMELEALSLEENLARLRKLRRSLD